MCSSLTSPLRQGNDRDPGESHAFVEASDVLLVAREAIERLRQYDVETSALCVGDQFLNARPKKRSPRDCAIRIAVDDIPALPFRMQPTKPQLIFDPGIALIFAAVAGIEGGT
jgi:hypothetical protein